MNDIIDEQTTVTPEVNESAIKNDGENGVSLGKFKSVDSLINAYNSLQSEFTKRCQKIKELEGRLSADKSDVSVPTEKNDEASVKTVTEEDKRKILEEYLKGVIGSKQNAVVLSDNGVGVTTPVSRPKSLSEAGILAKELLTDKN